MYVLYTVYPGTYNFLRSLTYTVFDDNHQNPVPGNNIMNLDVEEQELLLDENQLLAEMQQQEDHPPPGIFADDLNEEDGGDDDDEVLNDESLPNIPQPPPLNAAQINNDQDEISLWCQQHGMSHLAEKFKNSGFREVEFLINMNKEEMKECEFNLGDRVKLGVLFEREKAAQSANVHHGNIHVIRRAAKSHQNDDPESQAMVDVNNGWNNEVHVNGRRRIKFTNKPSMQLMIKCRDKCINVALNECKSKDIKKIRIAIDNNTKNGDISQARYYHDGNTWPNAPLQLTYSLIHRCADVGVVEIEWENYTQKSRGGYATYSGSIRRVKLSEVWGNATAEGRRKLKKFIDDIKGCDWVGYSHNQDDYRNAMALGLLGVNEPNYELNLEDVLPAMNE